METCTIGDSDGQEDYSFLLSTIKSVFSSTNALSQSFLIPGDYSKSEFTLNIDEINRAYQLMLNVDHEQIITNLMDATEIIVKKVYSKLKQHPNASPALLRIMIIVLLNPLLHSTKYYQSLMQDLLKSIDRLHSKGQQLLVSWFSKFQNDQMLQILHPIMEYLCHVGPSYQEILPTNFKGAVKAISLISQANELCQSPIALSKFYASKLLPKLNFKDEYRQWRKCLDDKTGKGFSILNYPCLLDPVAKSRIMHIDAMVKMSLEYEDACVSQSMIQYAQKFLDSSQILDDFEKNMQRNTNPYFVLQIRRSHIIEDTINQLSKQNEYRKPLKVKFIGGGEEGLDQGGVQKEFFQVFASHILDPSLGMFLYDDETRLSWFKPGSLESSKNFEYFGIILGLALYNGVMLGVSFPVVMYKKLLGEQITFLDFKHSFPSLGAGLEQLLEWQGNDVQEVFMRSFEINFEVFGTIECYELVENGRNIWVTSENRNEFVKLYIDYYVNKSIQNQFDGLRNGFHNVCGGDALSLCRPEELELLLCGKLSQELDFAELESGATYDDGYSAHHTVIKWFWEIVHNMDMMHKKFLLEFVTASDRIPLKGLQSLMFVIQRNGPDTNRLPSALTCFGRLLLPEYSSKEKLQKVLYLAIENAKGFGLV